MAILFKNVLFILLCMTDLTLVLQKTETFFCNLHVQYIYLTHGLYTMYHTFHEKQARIQSWGGGGDRSSGLSHRSP